jgi:hypothetical protein
LGIDHRALGIEHWVTACLLAVAPAACGKKGPPLPPIVRVPDVVTQVTPRRVGDDVFLTVTLPVQNIDGSTPVDLQRVDVYGYTGRTAPPAARFAEVARLVGTATVAAAGAGTMTIRDTLTQDELVPGPPLTVGRASGPAAAGPEGNSRLPLRRFYQVTALSTRNRPGPPSAILDVGLIQPPDAPVEVTSSYTAETVTISWSPSGGLLGFLVDLAPPPTAAPLDDGGLPDDAGRLASGPTRYNVYLEAVAAEAADPGAGGADVADVVTPPRPVNAAPVTGLRFTAPLAVDGRERCYRVSAVRGAGERTIEGRLSRPTCFVPLDTFAPAPPTGLSPIATEGAVSLVWEANREPDLRGYDVRRGVAGAETLESITPEPITETRFTDTTVMPGTQYVYTVVAVDSTQPAPNFSEESDRVTVTAR